MSEPQRPGEYPDADHVLDEVRWVAGAIEYMDHCDKRITDLIAERDKLLTDRAGWAARSKADFDRLGAALKPVRRTRSTGEPACSDGEAVEELVAERDKLAYMIEYIESLDPVIVEWARAGFQQEAKP